MINPPRRSSLTRKYKLLLKKNNPGLKSIREGAESFFVFLEGHHVYGIPGAPFQKRVHRTFRSAFLAPDTQQRINLNPFELRSVRIRHFAHTVLDRTFRHTDRRPATTSAGVIDHSKNLRFALPLSGTLCFLRDGHDILFLKRLVRFLQAHGVKPFFDKLVRINTRN